MSKPIGAAAPHHQRQHIPRKIPRAPQVPCARRRATPRVAGMLRRHSGSALWPPPPASPSPKPSASAPQPAARREPTWPRTLIFSACPPTSSAFLLLFVVDLCVHVAAPAAPRALVELRSGCLRCQGPRRPLYELLGLQRRQQRRYAERSNARDPPKERACGPISALSSLHTGDSFVPCWCWQVGETLPSHTA